MQIGWPFKQLSFNLPWTTASASTEWTAVDLEGGVIAVRVKKPRKTKEKPAITGFYYKKGLAPSGRALQQMAQALGGLRAAAVNYSLVLSRGDYQVFLMDKPAVRAEEVDQSLRWALTPLLDYPAADANLSSIEIPAAESGPGMIQKIYLVACKHSLADQQAALFLLSKINLKAIDIRQTSHRNIAALLGGENSGVCLVVAEQSGIQITISFNGDLYLERFLRESVLHEDAKNVGGRSIDSSAFDRIANEIQRSMDFVARSYPFLASVRVVTGPTPFDISLSQELNSRLGQPVEALDLSSLFDWPPGSELAKPEVQAHCLHALGAALRD
jgi:hypothetical protein